MAFARVVALTVAGTGLLAVLSSCSTANISDVYTAQDSAGERKRTVFYTDSNEVHCIVKAGIGRQDATVDVLIRQLQFFDFNGPNGGGFAPTNRVIANIEAQPTPTDGIQTIDMSLNPLPPDGSTTSSTTDIPFPVGHFQCEASLDGELKETAVFNIMFPPCPSSFIMPSTTCFGFYPAGQNCKRYGDSAGDTTNCNCTIDKGWVCDS